MHHRGRDGEHAGPPQVLPSRGWTTALSSPSLGLPAPFRLFRIEVWHVANLGQAEALIEHRKQTIGSRGQPTVE
jgi:hypothetical protein